MGAVVVVMPPSEAAATTLLKAQRGLYAPQRRSLRTGAVQLRTGSAPTHRESARGRGCP
ncbi:hypothetical protein GCM10009811_33470 [Nostocoides veronense]|uniref:Uncharacterized protein n=1 Tax=Nostocoides veronense TaxID=330836 RepID=A0ABP4YEC7_9MICO